MAAPRPLTAIEQDELRRRHADGQSLHAIAQEMGRSKRTISEYAKKIGLSWDRSRTAAATKARVADAKDRRARLALDLLDDVEQLRAQLWAPASYVDHGGKDFTRVDWTLDRPVFADQLKIMQAVNIGVEKHLRITNHDAGGSEAVRSLLTGLADQLGLTNPDQ
ncbi:helix-turn-helix domain-containing protein [Yimella sp. cx-573]|nr:helix-turn-helix domain-containing protein [Yimella sp. cx-573]